MIVTVAPHAKLRRFNVNHLTGTETTREVITFVARVRELKVGLGITDNERMAQFHTTVLTLLHGSAKEAYKVAAKEAATDRRTKITEQETVQRNSGTPHVMRLQRPHVMPRRKPTLMKPLSSSKRTSKSD